MQKRLEKEIITLMQNNRIFSIVIINKNIKAGKINK